MFGSVINIDIAIVLVFLIISLIVGMLAGKNIVSVKDYAIANRQYATPILLISITATMIGGGNTIGEAAEMYEHGLIYCFATLGAIVAVLLIGRLIAPKFDHRFNNMISIADMIKYFYGNKAEKISAFVSYLYCLILVSFQVIAFGNVANVFLGIDFMLGAIIAGFVITTYSAYGGIRAVTITDIMQFIILACILPVIAYVALSHVGGISGLLELIPDSHLRITSHPLFHSHIVLFFLWCTPFLLLTPEFIQRFLMAKDKKQIVFICYYFAYFWLILLVLLTIITFSAKIAFPDAEPNSIISLMVNEYLPVGIKGIAISGILAAIMSTADSCLNTATVLITNNFLPKRMRKLWIMKCNTIITGLLAIVIGSYNFNIISAAVVTYLFLSAAVGIPLFVAILGYKVEKKLYYLSIITSILVFFIFEYSFDHSKNYINAFIANITSFMVFVLACYFGRKKKEIKQNQLKSVNWLTKIWCFCLKFCLKRWILLKVFLKKNIPEFDLQEIEDNYIALGIFCSLNFMIPYFMWTPSADSDYTIILRFIAGLLSISLLSKPLFNDTYLKKYFPAFWCTTLTYCLPFFTTVTILSNKFDPIWAVNLSLSIFLLSALVDWLKFIIMMTFGIVAGYLCTKYLDLMALDLDRKAIHIITYTAVFSSLIGLIFNRKREIVNTEKLNVLRTFGAAIAHEVKEPMSTLYMYTSQISEIINKIKISVEDDPQLHEQIHEYHQLNDLIIEKIKESFSTIDIMLTSMKMETNTTDKKKNSIKHDIEEVLNNCVHNKYLKQIQFDSSNDIIYYGSQHLIRHVIINIINNAIKYAFYKKNTTLKIWMEDNCLYFYDNGVGISQDNLIKVFDLFYTGSSQGTGVGLAFCKKVMLDISGDIKCTSEKEKFTNFILSFPN